MVPNRFTISLSPSGPPLGPRAIVRRRLGGSLGEEVPDSPFEARRFVAGRRSDRARSNHDVACSDPHPIASRRVPSVRVAVFDLGSSSFHLMVVDATREGVLTPVLRRRSFLHLGTEVARTGGVPTDRATSAVRAVRRLHAAAEDAGVDVVVALATAALRDADNGASLVARLEGILGTSITLLAGEEEARLCFLGQRAGVWVGHEPVLGLDLGGGSLEAGAGTVDEIFAVSSMPLGTARLRGELGTGELLTREDRLDIARLVRTRSGPVEALLGEVPTARNRVIASGGTVRALARLATVLHRPETASAAVRPVNQVELPAGQLFELTDRLSTLDLDARLALPGIQARRAPLLPIGAVVLSTLVADLGLDRLVVSEWGLREGAVLSALALRPERSQLREPEPLGTSPESRLVPG